MTKIKINKGFTLLEIMIVSAIIIILAAASYPLYKNFYRLSGVDATRNEVVANLRITREWATSSKNNSPAGMYFSGSDYVIFSGDDYLSRNQNYDLEFSVDDKLVFSGDLEIVFDKITGYVDATETLIVTNTITGDQLNIEVLTSGVIQ